MGGPEGGNYFLEKYAHFLHTALTTHWRSVLHHFIAAFAARKLDFGVKFCDFCSPSLLRPYHCPRNGSLKARFWPLIWLQLHK